MQNYFLAFLVFPGIDMIGDPSNENVNSYWCLFGLFCKERPFKQLWRLCSYYHALSSGHLLPAVHSVCMKDSLPSLLLLLFKLKDSELNFKAPWGGWKSRQTGPFPAALVCVLGRSLGDYRGDWSRGLALTMVNNATNPMRPFGLASPHFILS